MKLFEYIGTLERRELYSILNIFRLHQSPNDQRVVANKSNPNQSRIVQIWQLKLNFDQV